MNEKEIIVSDIILKINDFVQEPDYFDEIIISESADYLRKTKSKTPTVIVYWAGCRYVPISLAKEFPDADIISCDCNKPRKIANTNANINNTIISCLAIPKDNWRHINCLPNTISDDTKFDIIIYKNISDSTPINKDNEVWYNHLPIEIANFADRHLKYKGKLFFEFSNKYDDYSIEELQEMDFYSDYLKINKIEKTPNSDLHLICAERED